MGIFIGHHLVPITFCVAFYVALCFFVFAVGYGSRTTARALALAAESPSKPGSPALHGTRKGVIVHNSYVYHR